MDFVDYMRIFGSLLTALSVSFGIYVYRRNEDRHMFASFRDSLGDLRNHVSSLDYLLSESEFSVLGTNVTNRLRALKPPKWSRDEFIKYLVDKNNHSQVAAAIHQGRLDSPSIEPSRQLLAKIRTAPFRYKEQLPVVGLILGKLLFYIERVAATALSPQLLNSGIGNPKAIKEALVPELEKYEEEEQIFAEIAVFIGSFPAAAMQMDSMGQKLFDESERLIKILADAFSRKSDAELRKSGKQQRKSHSELRKISNEYAIDDAFAYFKAIRSEFTDDEWNRIVESKTRILEYVRRSNEKK